jgi:hypothetical protein
MLTFQSSPFVFSLPFFALFHHPNSILPSVKLQNKNKTKQSVTYHDNSNDEIELTDSDRDNPKPTNHSCNNFLTSMDTILMCATGLVCMIIYGIVQGLIYRNYELPIYFADPLLEDIANGSL